jgi:hypothetical protein
VAFMGSVSVAFSDSFPVVLTPSHTLLSTDSSVLWRAWAIPDDAVSPFGIPLPMSLT